MKFYWVVLWSLWAARLVQQPTPLVHVTGGWLRGVLAPDGSHKRYLAIPYARHPIKRFQGPDVNLNWDGVFEAIEENVRCFQRIGKSLVVGQKNCLTLNIYTPLDASHNSRYPVMVFFHGGGFYDGSWVLQFKPVYMASLITKVMGHLTEDAQELYKILLNKSDSELIVTRVPRKEGNIIISECLYTPCIEKQFEGIEPFLTAVPYNVLTKGHYNKVPIMIGSNIEEGLLFASLENDTTIPNIKLEKSLPKDLSIPLESERKKIGDKLRNYYIGDEEISKRTLANLSRFHGEVYFTYPILEETEIYLNTNDKPVYSYLFKYSGWRNFIKLAIGKTFESKKGATHAEDLFYLFRVMGLPTLFEDKMINRMTTLWTNFAKFGDPTPAVSELLPLRWPAATFSSPVSFVIDEEFSISHLWYTDSLKYLRDVYTKYRRKRD
ncbi:antennal esterase CXE17 [Danaus plexippus plexippus]|uniref:Antennal esterase CXE17 n=1 Tax=Danaus plexippus plexippus TaxID=278856 RepID=A0A212EK17_DANPL|nr:antennal esterase CXE17 [Danaus plexippus plexippus]